MSGSHSDIGDRPAAPPVVSSIEALHERAMTIALDFLARSNALQGTGDAVAFVGAHIARQIGAGETRVLMLSNAAIDAYRRREQSAIATQGK